MDPIPTGAPPTMQFGSDTVTQTQAGPNVPNAGYTVTPGAAGNTGAAVNTGYVAPTGNSPVTTSSDFRNYTNNVGNNNNTLQTNSDNLSKLLELYDPSKMSFDATTALNNSNTLYENRRTQLANQQAAELKALNDTYSARSTQITDMQNKDTAPVQSKLDLLEGAGSVNGGPNAGPNAGIDEQLNQQKAKIIQGYQDELNTLFTQQQGYILNSNKAYNESDFALAESEQKSAQAVQDNMYQKQKDFTNLYLQITNQQRQDAATQYTQMKDQQTFNKDNGINAPFYQKPGSSVVYDSRTGQQLTYDQYQAAGGQGKPGAAFPDVQLVQPQMNSASGKEYQDYVNSGGKLSFNDYLNMDANRKASRSTSITYNQSVSEAQNQASSVIGQTFQKLAGNDGYVSPEDYKKGLAKWTSAGYSASDFNKQFLNYMNPVDEQRGNYGVTK